jgi:hypothetical protein
VVVGCRGQMRGVCRGGDDSKSWKWWPGGMTFTAHAAQMMDGHGASGGAGHTPPRI